MFKFRPTLKYPLMVIIAASIHGGLTRMHYVVILTTLWWRHHCQPYLTAGEMKPLERTDNLLKATQLCKEQGQVSIPILLHLEELLIFRQIMPNSLVLRIPCLKTNKTVLVRSLGFGPGRWCHWALSVSFYLLHLSSWRLHTTLCPPRWPGCSSDDHSDLEWTPPI